MKLFTNGTARKGNPVSSIVYSILILFISGKLILTKSTSREILRPPNNTCHTDERSEERAVYPWGKHLSLIRTLRLSLP